MGRSQSLVNPFSKWSTKPPELGRESLSHTNTTDEIVHNVSDFNQRPLHIVIVIPLSFVPLVSTLTRVQFCLNSDCTSARMSG